MTNGFLIPTTLDRSPNVTALHRAPFYVLEGIDGAGTTTQAQALAHHLRRKGRQVLVTREPSVGPVGALIRQALTHRFVVPGPSGSTAPSQDTLALLFAADRLDHLQTEILPALYRGVTVICDRYDLSSMAYQSVTAPNPDAQVEWLRALNDRALRPDVTFVLQVSAETAASRRALRGEATELFEVDEMQEKLVRAYQRAGRLMASDEVRNINAEVPFDVVTASLERQIDQWEETQERD